MMLDFFDGSDLVIYYILLYEIARNDFYFFR